MEQGELLSQPELDTHVLSKLLKSHQTPPQGWTEIECQLISARPVLSAQPIGHFNNEPVRLATCYGYSMMEHKTDLGIFHSFWSIYQLHAHRSLELKNQRGRFKVQAITAGVPRLVAQYLKELASIQLNPLSQHLKDQMVLRVRMDYCFAAVAQEPTLLP